MGELGNGGVRKKSLHFHLMTTTLAAPGLLLERRRERLADELARAAADGWLVYDFRGSNPAFVRLLGEQLPKSTRRAFLYVPSRQSGGSPRLLIHHVDAGNFG